MHDNKEPIQLDCTWNDGAHCGLTDWYDTLEKALVAALSRGPRARWTTGWYASKKEIASARITCRDGEIRVEASCSDDFDTEGNGSRTIPFTRNLDAIRQAVSAAWEDAEEDKKQNECFCGYSIGRRTGPRHRGRRMESWKYTFIKDVSGVGLAQPPGDNYARWGWEEDGVSIPARTKKKLEDGMGRCVPVIYAGDWMAESWDHHDEHQYDFLKKK